MVIEDYKVISAYVNALALDLLIGPLQTYDLTPSEVRSLWACDLEGNILLLFAGTREGVASLTYKVLGTIVGVLEAEGLMNSAFGVLGAVISFE